MYIYDGAMYSSAPFLPLDPFTLWTVTIVSVGRWQHIREAEKTLQFLRVSYHVYLQNFVQAKSCGVVELIRFVGYISGGGMGRGSP